ncbi:MAG: hypothetical protein WAU07_01000 [Microgenomates group bacterium]
MKSISKQKTTLAKKLIALVTNASAFILSFFLFAQQAFAQSAWSGVCVGGEDNDVATIQGLECLIGNVFQVILTVIGLSGFVMMIIGAFKWLVSGGNAKGVESARNTITFAVVGLVVALSAFIILNLIAAFTGVNVITSFVIPEST